MSHKPVTQEELDRFSARFKAALLEARQTAQCHRIADIVAENGGDVISEQAAFRWLKGQALPSLRNIRALAHALGTTIDAIYG